MTENVCVDFEIDNISIGSCLLLNIGIYILQSNTIAKVLKIRLNVFAIPLGKCTTVLQVFSILLKSIADICHTFKSVASIPAKH